MKRHNVPKIILELIVILGFMVLGVTILTYINHQENITKTLTGLIVLTISVLSFTEFIALKMAAKLKSIQNVVVSVIGVALGIIFIALRIDIKTICVMWGIYSLAFSLSRIVTGVLNLLRQPLLNIVRIFIGIACIVLSILLIIRTVDFIKAYYSFIGISLSVESFILLIEFIIHRYQN